MLTPIILIISILWIVFDGFSLYLHRRSTIQLYGIALRALYSGLKLLIRFIILAIMLVPVYEVVNSAKPDYSIVFGEMKWLLLMSTLFVAEFIFEQDFFHWHTGKNPNPEKTENKNFKAYLKCKPTYRLPWNIIYAIGVGAYLYYYFRLTSLFLPFLLWILTDAVIWCLNLDWHELLYYTHLRKKVLASMNSWYVWKNFLYGIIIQDDTNRIPTTFGCSKFENHPSDIVIFDNKTELIPYYETEKITDYTLWFYLHSSIFIYAFDTSRYTKAELEIKLTEAVTYLDYAVYRPTYIYLIGNKENLQWAIDKYGWMPDISINIVSDGAYISPKEAIGDFQNRMRPEFTAAELEEYEMLCKKKHWILSPPPYVGHYELYDYKDSRHLRYYLQPDSYVDGMITNIFLFLFHTPLGFPSTDYRSYCAAHTEKPYSRIKKNNPSVFFRNYNKCVSHIYQSIPRIDDMYYFLPENEIMCGFFQNIFTPNERKTAILAGFDYADMCMRFVYYYTLSKHNIPFSPELIKSDLQSLGDGIIKYTDTNDFLYETITKPQNVINHSVKFALDILSDLYYLQFEGDSITFAGLINLLRHIRNETRGHGSIRDEIAEPLWHALYVLLVIFSDFLRVCNFRLVVEDNKVYASYPSDSEKYDLQEYCFVEEGIPCPMYQTHNKHNDYINFIRGKVFIPEVIDR